MRAPSAPAARDEQPSASPHPELPLSERFDVTPLLERHRREGGWRTLSRVITLLENTPPWDVDIPQAERPVHIIGITGPPGAGKSMLAGRLIEAYADAGNRVGVIAVDPSSPVSGGAVLGDRVRMEPFLGRDDVYVRSLASRGSHGALASSARNIVRLLEASGSIDVLLVETVGAGQTEVAIASLADTVVLVTVPGLGDAVQAIKAGLVEVADFIVVNMADRPGAAETMRHFRLTLGHDVTVMKTTAVTGEGIPELRDELDRRWNEFGEGGLIEERRREKQRVEAGLIAGEWIRSCARNGTASEALTIHETVRTILEEAAAKWRS